MLTHEIKTMPVEQRMMLMEQIWDSLCHEEQEISSPTWHQQILAERMQLIKTGEAKFISINTFLSFPRSSAHRYTQVQNSRFA